MQLTSFCNPKQLTFYFQLMADAVNHLLMLEI